MIKNLTFYFLLCQAANGKFPWMGNVDNVSFYGCLFRHRLSLVITMQGGPLSSHWLQGTLQLQHKILERMRTFGMIPVLPAFAGHVPRAMEK